MGVEADVHIIGVVCGHLLGERVEDVSLGLDHWPLEVVGKGWVKDVVEKHLEQGLLFAERLCASGAVDEAARNRAHGLVEGNERRAGEDPVLAQPHEIRVDEPRGKDGHLRRLRHVVSDAFLDMVKRFGEKSKCNPDLFTLHFLRDFSLCT